MGYILYFSDGCSDNPYGYYLGKIHYQSGVKNAVNYPSCTDEKDHPKIKVYKTEKNALKTAETVVRDCHYVTEFELIPVN